MSLFPSQIHQAKKAHPRSRERPHDEAVECKGEESESERRCSPTVVNVCHGVQDREAKLADKEKRIVELKNDIRGLEKLKFLQDHQLMAMKEEIERGMKLMGITKIDQLNRENLRWR